MDASRLSHLDARRIGLIKPSALGDVVQTLPVLPVLRRRFPAARISWVINTGLAELLEGHPDLDELIRFDRHGSWRSWFRLLNDLRRRRFDLVFDLQGLLRTGIMTAATGAPLRVGLQTAREGAHLACHWTVPDTGRDVPAHRRYGRIAEALGARELPQTIRLALTRSEIDWADDQLAELPRPVLAVNPGARWPTKRWPVEKFALLAARAVRSYELGLVILGSPAERPLADRLETQVRRSVSDPPVHNLAGRTGLRQLAALLERVDLLLTNDSGPMHLAAGLGTPVVGLFTCTSPVLSGPPGDQHELVATKVSCAASYRKRCPYRGREHLACLEELDVERVWQALVRVIEKNSLSPRAA